MISVARMNDCLLAGLCDEEAQEIVEQCFDQIAKFTASHMTNAAGILIKKSGGPCDREKIYSLMLEDMYALIFFSERN